MHVAKVGNECEGKVQFKKGYFECRGIVAENGGGGGVNGERGGDSEANRHS